METNAKPPRQKSTPLSERELDVVRLVARGLRNREIGKELEIAEGTVKIHLGKIYKKLQVPTRLMLTETISFCNPPAG